MAGSEGDGYGEFSGGGSVKWKLVVNNGVPGKPGPPDGSHGGPNAFMMNGVDTYDNGADPQTVQYFEVTIQQPAAGAIHTVTEDGVLKLYLPVSKQAGPKPQIKVVWGREIGVPGSPATSVI